jgi:ABC-type amino acid transport system permease subunit
MMNAIDIVFVKRFIEAFYVNMTVACAALVIGVLIGLPFAYVRQYGGLPGRCVGFVNGLLRASPVFVLMFLVMNIWGQHSGDLFWVHFDLPYIALVLALSSYSVSVISDVCLEMLTRLREKDMQSALLIVPNLFRIFTVLVMATSVGVAVGVQEAITVTLDRMESLSSRSEKIWLVLFVLVCFVLFFATVKYLVERLVAFFKRKGQTTESSGL